MRIIRKLVSIFLLLIVISCVITSGACARLINGRDPYFEPYPTPEWQSALSEEEHYQNIVDRTEAYVENEIARTHYRLKIISYEIHIVYSFDDNPEYFVVDFNWGSDYDNLYYDEKTHIIGLIENDEYYIIKPLQEEGASLYKKAGVLDKKLYLYYDAYEYSEFAYENDGNIISIFIIRKEIYDPSNIKERPSGLHDNVYGKL